MNLRVKEATVIILILGFILANARTAHYKDLKVDTIMNQIEKTVDVSGMDVFSDGLQLKKDFSLLQKDYDGVVYYGHQTVMNSEKIVIIKLKDESQGAAIISEIQVLNEKTAKLFQSYAPDQYELLSNCVLIQKGQYILYTVSEKADQIKSAFLKSIKG